MSLIIIGEVNIFFSLPVYDVSWSWVIVHCWANTYTYLEIYYRSQGSVVLFWQSVVLQVFRITHAVFRINPNYVPYLYAEWLQSKISDLY